MKSLFASLAWKDVGKGFILAVLTVIVSGVYTALQATPVHFPSLAELQSIGLMGLGAGLAYLLKNFLTNSSDQFLTKEKKCLR